MRHQDTYRNSGLDRAKPKHRFHAFINRNFKRHRSDVGLVEDSTSSTTVVRIIIGLILVHLIVIGGVLLRGHITKSGAGIAVAPSITPPPASTAEESPEVLPQPAAPAAATTAAPAANHITQAPAADAEMVAEEPVTIVTPAPAPAAPATPARKVTVKHLVASGDTWGKIARQYGVAIDDLKAANPVSAKKNMLYSGTYLNVPVDSGSEAAKQAEAAPIPTEPAAKTYTVKSGDTIGKIARLHKMSAAKLLRINDMTDKDARRIRPGMELKVSE